MYFSCAIRNVPMSLLTTSSTVDASGNNLPSFSNVLGCSITSPFIVQASISRMGVCLDMFLLVLI